MNQGGITHQEDDEINKVAQYILCDFWMLSQ